ncbi:MAG: hypothetical protein R2932_09965 [Caldilineaceae bacterium]
MITENPQDVKPQFASLASKIDELLQAAIVPDDGGANYSPYNPPIRRRTFEQFHSDMKSRAGDLYDVEFTCQCADRDESGDASLIHSILDGHIT